MSFDIGQDCFRNNQCSSGFCQEGVCGNPRRLHDPCHQMNCPDSLTCSHFSHTCIPVQGYTPFLRGLCFSASDCKYNQICINGSCQATRSIGSRCKSSEYCAMGSKCTVGNSVSERAKCFELCSNTVRCPIGFRCIRNIWNPDSICVESRSNESVRNWTKSEIKGIIFGFVLIIVGIVILLFMIYGWIKFTDGDKSDHPEIINGKRKKKKVKLSYDGNGLATITMIPSNSQSPTQPVAASQLFVNPYNANSYPDAPPEYSQVITILQ